ncbi:MAG: hypothetical protein WCX61_02525 [Candidatus Peribacteraceae bacterium]
MTYKEITAIKWIAIKYGEDSTQVDMISDRLNIRRWLDRQRESQVEHIVCSSIKDRLLRPPTEVGLAHVLQWENTVPEANG